eukprot:scaffold32.g3810.t1
MDDEIAQYYRLDAVITVVDAKHGMATLDQQTEAQKQVGFADRILISKKDLVNESDYEALRARLVRMNPRAPVTAMNFGNADLTSIIDISGFNLDSILNIDPHFLADEHPQSPHNHPPHRDHVGECEPHCDHDHHPAHDDEIGAFVFRSNKPFDPARLEEFLGGVVQVYGPDLLRYKGILYMKGINRRMLFQGVHMMMGAEPGKPWNAAEKPSTKMVFIGRKLPQEIFTQGLEQCLAG